MKALASLTAAIVAVAIVAGCGGDGDSNGAEAPSAADGAGATQGPSGAGAPAAEDGQVTTSSLSKAQFLKRANAICVRAREDRYEEVEAYAREHADEPQQERLDGGLREVYAPSFQAQFDKIRELGAPRGDEMRVTKIIAAFEDLVDVIERKGADAQGALDRGIERAGGLAFEYGLRQCTYS